MTPTLRSLRSNAAATPPNARRSTRTPKSIPQSGDHDDSSDGSDDDSDDESYYLPLKRERSDRVLRSGKRRKLSKQSSRYQSPSLSASKREGSRKRMVRRTRYSTRSPPKPSPKKPKEPKQNDNCSTTVGNRGVIQSEGRIPAWDRLPYFILVQIFTFAAYPFYDDQYWPQPSISWLLGLSRVCRSFTEPALTALYHTPPLYQSPRGSTLIKLLTLPSNKKTFNYNNKIRRLEIEASRTPQPDISALILLLPQLEDLAVFHLADRPPYRQSWVAKRWLYPDSLFTTLEAAGIHLRSWRWNTRFCGQNRTPQHLEYIHLQPAFRGLEKLVFTNYQQSDDGRLNGNTRTTNEEHLARAVSALQSLKSLSFECCSIINGVLLPLLPNNLSALSITNCPNLTSDVLHPFLITHGSHLRELVLNHNWSLNLSFSPDLAIACPQLEVLKMDFQYYSSVSYRSTEPKFKDLLLLHEVPTWPPMLQSIDLSHLRQWGSLEVADMFFRSLTNSAADLPHLRKLVLRVILKTGWRDRAHFRDDWIHKLERVFLRKADPPNIELQSLSRWKTHKAKVEAEDCIGKPVLDDEADEDVVVRMPRRSLRTRPKDMKDAKHEASPQALERKVPCTAHHKQPSEDEEYARGVQVVVWNKSNAQVLVNLAKSPDRPRRERRRSIRLTELERLELSAGKDRSIHCYDPDDEDGSPSDISSNATGSGDSSNDSDSDSNSESDSENQSPDTSNRWSGEKGEITQGMCSVVDIRIDNLRLAETQFNEGDFLDEEASGDEEWDGNDLTFEDQNYAW
ncbi:hypothetical protein FGG08_003008 [Glutinoglossum americanum]|uniref:Uncharacterized protein n=1 Tax=Glutinoglossum americanum TaxID=1670608 RepID=A0A9P8KYL7_9PEZI|nr:hypothetical protein FGG08_003008 [Glutinoglossum americanum]